MLVQKPQFDQKLLKMGQAVRITTTKMRAFGNEYYYKYIDAILAKVEPFRIRIVFINSSGRIVDDEIRVEEVIKGHVKIDFMTVDKEADRIEFDCEDSE